MEIEDAIVRKTRENQLNSSVRAQWCVQQEATVVVGAFITAGNKTIMANKTVFIIFVAAVAVAAAAAAAASMVRTSN